MKELTTELKEKVRKAVKEKKIKKFNVKILKIKKRAVTAKLHTQKKPRVYVAYKTSTDDLIIQSEDTIIMLIGHYDNQWSLCLYNRVEGGEILPIHLSFGSKLILIDRNFITLMEKLQQ